MIKNQAGAKQQFLTRIIEKTHHSISGCLFKAKELDRTLGGAE